MTNIADMEATVRRCWELACKEEGIPIDNSFVCFSEGNRWAKGYDIAIRKLMEARAEQGRK